jgi:glycosyltransferase involved in cell wall biosynthesis
VTLTASRIDSSLPGGDDRALLSVIIPTYNRRELVLRAVQSILEQNVGAVEVIVIDDGSRDGTLQALQERFADDPRVQTLGRANGGASAARNAGLALARGELICFLDSDDYWLPGALARARAVLDEHPDIGFLSFEGYSLERPAALPDHRVVRGRCPGWRTPAFHATVFIESRIESPGQSTLANLIKGDFFPAATQGDLFYLSGLIIRRRIVEAAGPFNTRFRYYNDWDYFARICLQAPGAHLDIEGFCRDSGRIDQISSNRPLFAKAFRHIQILRLLRRQYGAQSAAYRSHLNLAQAAAHYWLGRCLMDTHRRRAARRYLLSAIRQRHKPIKSLLLLLRLSRR